MKKIVYAALLASLTSGAAMAQGQATQIYKFPNLVTDAAAVDTALTASPTLVTNLAELETRYPDAITQYTDDLTNLTTWFGKCTSGYSKCDTSIQDVQTAVTKAKAALGSVGAEGTAADLLSKMPSDKSQADFLTAGHAGHIAGPSGITAIAAQLQVGENEKFKIQGMLGSFLK